MTSPCSLDVVMYLSSSTRTLCKACSLSRPQLCIHYSFIVRTTPYHGAWCVGTEQNRFRRKTDEIAKFSILDGKTEFTILDGIWSKNGQSFNRSLEKNGQNRLGGVAEIGVYSCQKRRLYKLKSTICRRFRRRRFRRQTRPCWRLYSTSRRNRRKPATIFTARCYA